MWVCDSCYYGSREPYTISSITGAKLYKKQQNTLGAKLEILVAGYCRTATDYVTPKEVISLCQAYYKIEYDEWDASLTSINYRINQKSLSKIWNYGESKWSNAFGRKIIHRYNHRVWQIKLDNVLFKKQQNNEYNTMDGPLIGIMSEHKTKTKNIDIMDDGYCLNLRTGNCLHQNVAKSFADQIQFKSGDILTITLNLLKQTDGALSFHLNDEYLGIAYDNINTDKSWKLAVSAMSNCQLHLLL